MKFLKSQNISRYSPTDNTLHVTPTGRGVMDFRGAVMLPKGTEAERPVLSNVRQPQDANGYIRYNTDSNSIEAYVNGVWEVVRAPGASAITKETHGPGDDVSVIFGPLRTVAPGTSYQSSDHNILVYVENVFQISPTNYTVVQNPVDLDPATEVAAIAMVNDTEYKILDIGVLDPGPPATAPTDFTLVGAGWVNAGSFTIGQTYEIKKLGDTDFTLIGAASNTVGLTFTATDVGAGTGKALLSSYTQSVGDVFTFDNVNGAATGDGIVRETGYYLEFTSAVPSLSDIGNPVYITVYYGFEN